MAKIIGVVKGLEGKPWEKQKVIIAKLQEVSDALPEGEVVGGLIKFSVADGQALYLVVNAKPLYLKYVPHLDNYEETNYAIRGLRLQDVKSMLDWERCMKRESEKQCAARKALAVLVLGTIDRENPLVPQLESIVEKCYKDIRESYSDTICFAADVMRYADRKLRACLSKELRAIIRKMPAANRRHCQNYSDEELWHVLCERFDGVRRKVG